MSRIQNIMGGALLSLMALDASAQSKLTLTTLHTFTDSGVMLLSGLVESNGLLYGTNPVMGQAQWGGVYSIDPATGAESAVYLFSGGDDGGFTTAGLIAHGGMLYGVNQMGGSSGCGTVFRIDPADGTETTLYRFDGTTGCSPAAELLYYKGALYGTTTGGGTHNTGTVFTLDPATGAERVLYSLDSTVDGFNPSGALVAYNGLLYGTTSGGGGVQTYGTVFQVDPATGAFKVLHAFNRANNGGNEGAGPMGALVPLNGLLYGTAPAGSGQSSGGMVFSIDPPTGAEAIVKSFNGNNGNKGLIPMYGALLPIRGQLYGTTSAGGADGDGVVYSLDPASGRERLLYSFTNGADGGVPGSGLTLYNGSLYGTTLPGTVFRLSRNP